MVDVENLHKYKSWTFTLLLVDPLKITLNLSITEHVRRRRFTVKLHRYYWKLPSQIDQIQETTCYPKDVSLSLRHCRYHQQIVIHPDSSGGHHIWELTVKGKDNKMSINNDWNVLGQVIVLMLEVMAGIILNVFIVSVIFYDFHREKTMGNSNKILVCLGISNLAYNILVSAGLVDEFVGVRVPSTYFLSSMYIILLFYSVSSCAWLTACLGAFYFVTISQARLLTWVKFHISFIVPWMLLVLEVVSFINSSLGSLLLIPPHTSSWNITNSPPSVLKVIAQNKSELVNVVLCVTAIPLAAALISTMCTLWTLNQHKQKMEGSKATVDSERFMAYLQVVCRMTHLLIFYGIFYALVLIFYFSVIVKMKSGFWITLLLMSSFTPVQSVLLILSNPRLQGAWKEMFHYSALTKFLYGGNEG